MPVLVVVATTNSLEPSIPEIHESPNCAEHIIDIPFTFNDLTIN